VKNKTHKRMFFLDINVMEQAKGGQYDSTGFGDWTVTHMYSQHPSDFES